MEHEPLELFGVPAGTEVTIEPGSVHKLPGGGEAVTATIRMSAPRELFLTGLLAQWAATEREPGATPNREEKRRAAAGARAALEEIRR